MPTEDALPKPSPFSMSAEPVVVGGAAIGAAAAVHVDVAGRRPGTHKGPRRVPPAALVAGALEAVGAEQAPAALRRRVVVVVAVVDAEMLPRRHRPHGFDRVEYSWSNSCAAEHNVQLWWNVSAPLDMG